MKKEQMKPRSTNEKKKISKYVNNSAVKQLALQIMDSNDRFIKEQFIDPIKDIIDVKTQESFYTQFQKQEKIDFSSLGQLMQQKELTLRDSMTSYFKLTQNENDKLRQTDANIGSQYNEMLDDYDLKRDTRKIGKTGVGWLSQQKRLEQKKFMDQWIQKPTNKIYEQFRTKFQQNSRQKFDSRKLTSSQDRFINNKETQPIKKDSEMTIQDVRISMNKSQTIDDDFSSQQLRKPISNQTINVAKSVQFDQQNQVKIIFS